VYQFRCTEQNAPDNECHIFLVVGSQYGYCFLSPFWNIEFGGDPQIFGKCVHSWLMYRLKRGVIEI
jgi:hypothetical protein